MPSKLAITSIILAANVVAAGVEAARGEQNDATFLHIDSVATEPAVPLNLKLDVRVLPERRLVEVKVTLAKRKGYPADMFFDRDIKAEIALVAGLRLVDGALTWSGDLRGEQTAEFIARFLVMQDIDNVIHVAARGQARGGGIDADGESFRITARGDRITVAPDVMPVISPMRPADAQRAN